MNTKGGHMDKDLIHRVVFRKLLYGTVIALFPQIVTDEDPAYCKGYSLRHGWEACHVGGFRKHSRRARPDEYARVKARLEEMGYAMKVSGTMDWTDYDSRRRRVESQKRVKASHV